MSETTNFKKMVTEYLSNPNRLKNTDGLTLKALNVSKADFETLNGLEGVDKFMILLAVSNADIDKAPEDQNFTTIIAPVDTNGNIMESDMLNNFEPCPSNCSDYDSVFNND